MLDTATSYFVLESHEALFNLLLTTAIIIIHVLREVSMHWHVWIISAIIGAIQVKKFNE